MKTKITTGSICILTKILKDSKQLATTMCIRDIAKLLLKFFTESRKINTMSVDIELDQGSKDGRNIGGPRFQIKEIISDLV